MAGDGAGAEQGSEAPPAPGAAAGHRPEGWRDWAGLPEELLVKVAGKLVAQTEAGRAAALKKRYPNWTEEQCQEMTAKRKRKRDGNDLFVFARVCKEWRKAQVKVGGPLRTQVFSDVIWPGRVELAKWVLAEGCPWRNNGYTTMASAAAEYGHRELVVWLIQEQGFAMDWYVMEMAARGGNLELVKWLRGEGCPWDKMTCYDAVNFDHVEVLRWARENGAPWIAWTRDRAAAELGYTDDFGNLDNESDLESDDESDDEYGYDGDLFFDGF